MGKRNIRGESERKRLCTMRSKKYCKSYVGVACVNGSCPNALRNEDIEAYKDIYGTTRKQRCDRCAYYEGCKDCAVPNIEGVTEEECRFLEVMT